MYLLGYDIGSSSVKASLVNAETGKCVSSAFFPKTEAAIMAARPGWAEQDPQNWWENLKLSTQAVMAGSGIGPDGIAAIGISYQMHGLVCVDKGQNVLRPAIIWCDSRAVPYGLTGLWQVEKRGDAGKLSAKERKELDLKYGKEFSFFLDMKILFKTLTAFVQKGDV